MADTDSEASPTINKDFFPETVHAHTSRKWQDYIECLKLPSSEKTHFYQGKIIVDVGSGPKTSNEDATKFFPGAKIIAVDPNYIVDGKSAYPLETYDETDRRDFSREYRGIERRIGVAQNLPLGDHSADEIWSMMSVPMHIPLDHEGTMWLEFFRVTKPGGTIRVAPGFIPNSKTSRGSFVKLLTQHGYDVKYSKLEGRERTPQSVTVITTPQETIEEANKRRQSLEQYLRHMNLIASPDKDWSSNYFRKLKDHPGIESPLPQEEPTTD